MARHYSQSRKGRSKEARAGHRYNISHKHREAESKGMKGHHGKRMRHHNDEMHGYADNEMAHKGKEYYGMGYGEPSNLPQEKVHHELEEEYGDKYIGSCSFIKSQEDGNYEIASEEEIDIFEHSPHFRNLGTVTHWMPLPADPPGESKQARDRRVYATPKD